jgi:hypothetical protein
MTCNCRICERTRQFKRFQALLPETDRVEFEAWHSKMFDELEALETDRAMENYRKSKQLEMEPIA